MTRNTTWNWQQDDWPQWRFDSQALSGLESRFLLSSGRLLGAWQHLNGDDQSHMKISLLSEEAMKTSAIEGEYLDRESVQSSVRRQLGLGVDRKHRPAESGIAELMVACFEGFGAPLTHETFFTWHQLVCLGRTDLHDVGQYRTHLEPMQVVSGPLQKREVHCEAPSSTAMMQEMKGFIDWYQATSLPALTKAGLAHLWFVSIHPFEDGNCRIARALCEKILAQNLGQPSLLALSYQIEKDLKSYYAALEQNNKTMDVTPWLIWFAETALKAQTYSGAMIDLLIAKTKMMDRLRGQLNARQEKALLLLFDAGPEGFEGGLSAKNYRTITDSLEATATRDLRDLVAKGALRRTGDRKGTRYWLKI